MLSGKVRGVLVAVVLAFLTTTAWSGAAADECQVVEVTRSDGSVEYRTVCPEDGDEGTRDPGDGGAGGGPTCDLSTVEGVANYPYCVGTTACAVNNPSTLGEDAWPMEERPSPDHIYTWTWCESADGEVEYWWSWYLPEEQGPSLTELAQQAFGALRTPTYDVGFNPPRRAVVGVPTWFWADAAVDGPITGSSALGVVAIGEPDRLEVDPGDGSGVLTCPFTTTESDACSHTYGRSSVHGTAGADREPAYAVRMRLVYDVRFENAGAPLELPGLPTTLESAWQQTAVPVVEIQSVVGRP